MIKAIIMAGGEGTRLRPLTCNRPKPMIPVMNKPVIEHSINLLKKHGIKDIVLSLYYLPDNVQNYFGDGSDWNVNITYSVEETPLGTAGGVKQAIGKNDKTFIVLSGDGIIDFDITEILKSHREKKSLFTIILARVNQPTDYGIVILNKNGEVQKFLEKPSWSEVFSDAANTGMYVIEPEIISKFVPENAKFDFSLDLFPLLQKEKIAIYGHISEGYWCDVGNLTTYLNVHRDILNGLVKVDITGKKIAKNIRVGRDVYIHPGALLKGPLVIGNFVRIKKGAEVSEYSVIGDNCVIEENASIRRSIILHSTVIGPKCEIRGALIGKRCVLENFVSIYEGSVISDDCRLGSGVSIPTGIRVWPDKTIEAETRLTTDLIWGETEKKTLFGPYGITGRFNIKINPEFASKLGSAAGAYLGKNAKIVMCRDTTSASRLIKRALSAGLLAMGVDVYDMERESVPIAKFSMKFVNADLGIYIEISPMTGLQFIQISIFNKHGYRLSLSEEKKIENIFFRGDYPRKDALETGHLVYPTHHLDSYISNVKSYIVPDRIIEKKWSIIVDCFNGTGSHVFPDLLNAYGCQVTVIRGQMKEFISDESIKNETKKALGSVMEMSKINNEMGVIISPTCTDITIVDETGNMLTDDDICAILSLYHIKYSEAKKIHIPVTVSGKLVELIESSGGEAVKTSSKTFSPPDNEDIFLVNTSDRYPYIELAYDPMIAFLRILKYLSLENKSLFEIKETLPKSNIINSVIHCSMEEKAAIMRMLNTGEETKNIELIDGIKIYEEKAWVLILPDAALPIIHIYSEGETAKSRDEIIDKYTLKIKKFINRNSKENK